MPLGLLNAFAPLVFALAIGLAASRRRLVRSFLRVNATSEADAITPATRLGGAFWIRRLRRAGVLHVAPSGALWLDSRAWAAYRGIRRTRALVAVMVALVALLLVMRSAW